MREYRVRPVREPGPFAQVETRDQPLQGFTCRAQTVGVIAMIRSGPRRSYPLALALCLHSIGLTVEYPAIFAALALDPRPALVRVDVALGPWTVTRGYRAWAGQSKHREVATSLDDPACLRAYDPVSACVCGRMATTA